MFYCLIVLNKISSPVLNESSSRECHSCTAFRWPHGSSWAVSIRSIVRIIHSGLASSTWSVQFQAARANRNTGLQQGTEALVCTQGPRSLHFSLPWYVETQPPPPPQTTLARVPGVWWPQASVDTTAPELQAVVWISICSDLAICDQEVAISNSHSFLPSADREELLTRLNKNWKRLSARRSKILMAGAWK